MHNSGNGLKVMTGTFKIYIEAVSLLKHPTPSCMDNSRIMESLKLVPRSIVPDFHEQKSNIPSQESH